MIIPRYVFGEIGILDSFTRKEVLNADHFPFVTYAETEKVRQHLCSNGYITELLLNEVVIARLQGKI